MLKAVPLILQPKIRTLLEIWSQRYQPDALTLISAKSTTDLIASITAEGRSQTVNKVKKRLSLSCELAAVKTNTLFAVANNIVYLDDSRRLAEFVEKIYAKLLDIYQQQPVSLAWLALIDTLTHSNNVVEKLQQASSLSLTGIEQIADGLEPLILELQQQSFICRDRRMIGFMSTQFHFSTQLLLNEIDTLEQVLLTPYLRFVEEQVCMPWQRVCAAANQYPADSPILEVVTTMLRQTQDIEDITYQQIVKTFPEHRSRRGFLRNPDVTRSSIRDINMFQAYLWLCVLEGNMSSVEEELIPLCLMVFPSISVDWALAEQGIQMITAAIRNRLPTPSLEIVAPYLEAMVHLFINARQTPLFSSM